MTINYRKVLDTVSRFSPMSRLSD